MTRLTVLAVALAAATTAFSAHAQGGMAISGADHLAAPLPSAKAANGTAQTVDRRTTGSVQGRTRIDLSSKSPKRRLAGKNAAGGGRAAGGEKYHAIIARHAAAHGVPLNLAHAVIRIESNYRANARGRAGEVGLMQIKPSTARGLGYTGSVKALYDPETNIRYGMKYLGQAHRLGGGTTCGTILKYNAGHGARRMNPVSKAYCAKVQRHLGS